jgi:hypothetical protein
MRARRRTAVLASKAIDGESEEAGVLVCVFDPNRVQFYITTEVSSCSIYTRHVLGGRTASKSILVRRASMIGYFDATSLPYWIVVEVDIGAFVEAVVRGLLGWWGNIVVDVCEAFLVVSTSSCSRRKERAYSVNRDTSPCCGGIVLVLVAACAMHQASKISDGREVWRRNAAKSEQSHSQQ